MYDGNRLKPHDTHPFMEQDKFCSFTPPNAFRSHTWSIHFVIKMVT